MSVTLRRAVPADLPAVTEVLLDCWSQNIAAIAPASAVAALTPRRIAANWAGVLRGAEHGGALVAVAEGAVAGVTRFERDREGVGVVQSLYVSPRAQRLGIGARLLAAATKGLRDLGARRLTLWVIAANAPSIAFYRAQGWVPDGARRVQAEFGVDELRLEYVGRDSGPNRLAGELVAGDNAPAGAAVGLRSPGCAMDGVAGSRGVGEGAGPMTLGTSHDLASVTKILATTTALIGLASAGQVGLDDAVSRYLPAFTGCGKDDVTVRDLLRHRGGLWEWQPLYLHGRKGSDALNHVERLPLRYRPGAARNYSDLGFILLGRIVEIASGADLASAVRGLVTEPLGLAHTRFAGPATDDVAASAFGDRVERRMVATGEPYPVLGAAPPTSPVRGASERPGSAIHDGADASPLDAGDSRGRARDAAAAADGPSPRVGESGDAAAFDGWRNHVLVGEVNDGNAFHAFGGVSGHAGLFSTLGDLLRYATFLANFRDHGSLWKPSVVEEFLADGPDAEQALGFRRYPLTVDGQTSTMYGHPGFVGCAVGFSPASRTAVAMCTNRLLTSGEPVGTESMWARVREAVEPSIRTREADHE